MSCSFLTLVLFHGMVRSIILNGRPYLFSSALPSRGGVLSRTAPRMIPIGFHSFTNTKPFESVFLVLGLPRVLRLGPWPNICTDLSCLAFYPHNRPSRSFFPTPWRGKEDLDVIVAPSRPFFTTPKCKASFDYPSRVLNVSVYEVRFH